MGTPYFPGCTLATKAKNYDTSGKAVAAALGMPLDELPDWQCCGATFPLATDNTMSLIAPARVLIQAEQTHADKVTTLCAICYNVLKRTEVSLRKHPEQLERINWFVSTDETTAGQTYQGKVQVTHFLQQLRDDLGWKALSERVTQPLKGLKVAPYYGCLLLRPPAEIGLDDPDQPTIMADLLTALGAEPVDFPFKGECCGSYLAVNKPDVPAALSGTIVESAAKHGAQAIVTACPLCQYNLDVKHTLPVVYFTELIAAALGLGEEISNLKNRRLRFDI
jgi:heterodisulfide reductase subunit B